VCGGGAGGADTTSTGPTPPAVDSTVIVVEGAVPGRLLRVLHQLPGRRYRWAAADAHGEVHSSLSFPIGSRDLTLLACLNAVLCVRACVQEWRISTGSVRFAMSGMSLPSDPALGACTNSFLRGLLFQ
jgi:hypothetical protein